MKNNFNFKFKCYLMLYYYIFIDFFTFHIYNINQSIIANSFTGENID